jgi:hypothetical protein
MPPDDLLNWLRAKPFRPFRMVMSEGTIYEVRQPELCMVSTFGSAVVGYPSASLPGAIDRHDLVALSHVVRLELIDQPAPAGQSNGQSAQQE